MQRGFLFRIDCSWRKRLDEPATMCTLQLEAATADEVQLLEKAGFTYHSLGLKRASGNPLLRANGVWRNRAARAENATSGQTHRRAHWPRQAGAPARRENG